MKTCSNCENSTYTPQDSLDIQEVWDIEQCGKCNFYSEWEPRTLVLNFSQFKEKPDIYRGVEEKANAD